MVETKLIEVRDAGTFIPTVAMRMTAENEAQRYLMRRVGFHEPPLQRQPGLILMVLNTQRATSDPYDWEGLGMGPRTMPTVHLWLLDHFDEIEGGGVVDVEFILGETSEPKRSQRE